MTFENMTQRIGTFFLVWLKELNLRFYVTQWIELLFSLTQRIELFFCQEIWLKELNFFHDSKNWTFFFQKYDSKNWNIFWIKELNLFSRIRLKELNLFSTWLKELNMTQRFEPFFFVSIWPKELYFFMTQRIEPF